jgi:hypothetical protein
MLSSRAVYVATGYLLVIALTLIVAIAVTDIGIGTIIWARCWSWRRR